MHELSIALSILDLVEREAQRHGAVEVRAVHLKLGPLAGVVHKALLSAYGLACEICARPDCRLVIEETPILGDCPVCGGPQGVVSAQEMRCTICGTPITAVVGGRELEITAMEMVP